MENDFHGAIYYSEFESEDRSNSFLSAIENHFDFHSEPVFEQNNVDLNNSGIEETKKIAATFGINDINLVKPGIGETTRVLLRRVPY